MLYLLILRRFYEKNSVMKKSKSLNKKYKGLNKNYMRSICQLEGWDWKGETITEDDGMVVYRSYKLTQKPLKDLSPEDIRFLIGQQCGLPYLVPMALEILEKDFFIETEYYKGDLVEALLQIKDDNKYDYWPSHTEEKEKFCEMYMKNQQNMEEALDVSVSGHIIKEIRKQFDKFCKQ